MRAGGLQEYTLPENEVLEIRKAAMSAWEEEAKKSDMSRRLMESQVSVMRELGLLDQK